MAMQADIALENRFKALVDFVANQPSSGLPASDAPVFAYLLTPKQCDEIDRLCDANGWGRVTTYGVMFSVNDVRHILDSRMSKDGLTPAQIGLVVAKAYSPRSLVIPNPPPEDSTSVRRSHQQSLMLNTHQKVVIGTMKYYGVAILEIKAEGPRRYLAPVTCYHATEAKKRRIHR
jgi:hypothetical protein